MFKVNLEKVSLIPRTESADSPIQIWLWGQTLVALVCSRVCTAQIIGFCLQLSLRQKP